MSSKDIRQSISGVLLVLLICAAGLSMRTWLSYQAIAIILLMALSILSIRFAVVPVLIVATISALLLNFLFIPPYYTLHVYSSNDVLFLLIFFAVAITHIFLTKKIRATEKKVRDKEEKEQAIKLYNTVLNSLSHELRTPIAAIVSAVDTLQDTNGDLPEMQGKELVRQIDLAANRLNEQVENLLLASRLESGMIQLRRNWCDFHEMVNHQIQKKCATATHKIILRNNDELPLIYVDEGIFEQIIFNLLSNAVKHTPAGSEIVIAAEMREEHIFCFTVSDTGPGVDPEQIAFLFDKFYKTKSTTNKGCGLGLAIVKGYVEAHDGSIRAELIRPHGLAFVVQVPTQSSFINKLNYE